MNDNRPLDRRPEDRAPAPSAPGYEHDAEPDDLAIALDLDTLGEIENKVFTINGFNAEARTAIRHAVNLVGPGETRRLLFRAARALDDAIRVGGDLVGQTRGL